MMVVPDPNAYMQGLPLEQMDKDAHLRYVARRRWMAQREQERKRLRERRSAAIIDRVKRIRELRPGRAAANSLSPVYSMFNDAFLRSR